MLEGFIPIIDSISKIGMTVLVICLLFLGLFISIVIIIIRAIWRYLKNHSSRWFGGYDYDYMGMFNSYKKERDNGDKDSNWKVNNDDINKS